MNFLFGSDSTKESRIRSEKQSNYKCLIYNLIGATYQISCSYLEQKQQQNDAIATEYVKQ